MTNNTNPPSSANRTFRLGQIVITRNALDALHPNEIRRGLARHARCDWGDIDPSDWQLNEDALIHGDRLFSAYGKKARRYWIITEWDRSVTTVLLPGDY